MQLQFIIFIIATYKMHLHVHGETEEKERKKRKTGVSERQS